jgi:Tol biopolymer transport system component
MEENTMRFHPVEIQPGSNAFTVAPGSSAAVPFRIINRTGEDAYFEISVRGIPSTWVTLDVPVIHLADGEQRETTLSIQPPAGMAGATGATRMAIRVESQADPNQSGEALIDLYVGYDPNAQTIGAYQTDDPSAAAFSPGGSTLGTIPAIPPEGSAQPSFDSDLSPRRVDAGKNARLRIYNQSAVPETFLITWHNPEGDLEFVSSQTGPVRVMPGEVVSVDFAASPRNPNWVGSPLALPYSAVVRSSQGEAQAHNGEVVSRALVPIWVLPALLVFCLTSICGVGFLWNWSQNRLTAATATAVALQIGMAEAAAATATAEYELTEMAVINPDLDPTNIWLTITAAAEEAVPTETPIPTDTPLPEDTPLPTLTYTPTPQDTPLVIIVTSTPDDTNTPVPTPTNTPIPTLTDTPVPEPTPTFTPTETQQPLPPTPTQFPLPVTGQGLIAFVSDRQGDPQLFVYNASDDSLVSLTEGLGPVRHPVWSSDGARIAFAAEQEEGTDIFIMNRDGTGLVNLTNSPSNDRFPAWSPDGNFIVFTTDRDGNDEIYIMQSDGSNPTNLTNSPSNDSEPVWYEIGGLFGSESRILFTSDRDENDEIYAMNVDGSEPINLTNNPASETSPAIRYEGGPIAFVSDRDGNLEIYMMERNGGDQTNISNSPANDFQPVWSPDGDWIAFVSDRTGNEDIFILELGQDEAENLTQSPSQETYPTWR